jgi:hypothetical protein
MPFQFLGSSYTRHFFNPYLLFFAFHPHHTKLSPFCVTPLGEGRGCGIVTAICNCRPFAIVVAILATVACSLRPPNPPPGSRSLFSISLTHCDAGITPRGLGTGTQEDRGANECASICTSFIAGLGETKWGSVQRKLL